MAGLRGEVVYLFAFDVGNEMLTARVESQLARRASPLQIRRPQLAPPAVSFYRPLAGGEFDRQRAVKRHGWRGRVAAGGFGAGWPAGRVGDSTRAVSISLPTSNANR
jgi:hypothetical protein